MFNVRRRPKTVLSDQKHFWCVHFTTWFVLSDYVWISNRWDLIERVVQINDLGVLFDQKIRFIDHIEYIVSYSSAMLGFVFWICSDFDDVHLMEILYFAHVCSHLEYASFVWYPNYIVYIERIESIQNNTMFGNVDTFIMLNLHHISLGWIYWILNLCL